MRVDIIIATIVLSLVSSVTFASGNHAHKYGHSHSENKASSVGEPGDQSNVSRTIELKMTFNKFKPSKINVKKARRLSSPLKMSAIKTMKL